MRTPPSAPPPRVLTVRGAAALGYSKSSVATEVRNRRWQRLAAGVLLTRPDPPVRADWAQVGVLLGAHGSAVTGWDVARLDGLGPARPTHRKVLVITPGGKNREVGGVRLRPSRRLVLTRRTTAFDESSPAVPVVRVARAVADTALTCTSLASVRAMVTSAVQRQLCTYDELAAELEASPRNGSGHLRTALKDLAGGALSIAEAEAFALLRRSDIPPFQPNCAVRDGSGRVVAVADALWPHLRAILEVDSREFHFTEADWKRTMSRHNRLTGLGYAVAHYPPSAIRGGRRAWADGVLSWLACRADELNVSLFP